MQPGNSARGQQRHHQCAGTDAGAGNARRQAAPAGEPGLHAGDGRRVHQRNANTNANPVAQVNRGHRLRQAGAQQASRNAGHAGHANGARAKPVRQHAAAHTQHKVNQPAQAKDQGHIGPLRGKLGGT